jgi:hypothetical protein
LLVVASKIDDVLNSSNSPRDAAGRKTVTHYDTGKAYWQEPMPPGAMHKDVNETGKTIELIVVEIK